MAGASTPVPCPIGFFCADATTLPVPCASGTYSWAASASCTFLVTVSTFSGSTQRVYGFADGQGTNAKFDYVTGLAFDADGNLYVGDGPNRVVRRVAPDGGTVTLAGVPLNAGTADG
jgi:hypothetical protein